MLFRLSPFAGPCDSKAGPAEPSGQRALTEVPCAAKLAIANPSASSALGLSHSVRHGRQTALSFSKTALRALLLVVLLVLCAPAQTPPEPQSAAAPNQQQMEKKLEAYLRDLFAWGPTFEIKLGPFTDAVVPGFYEVPVQVKYSGETDAGVVYFSKDGKFLMRGEMHDLAVAPFAENRAKLHLDGSPSRGPADAPVTVVEFSDFQCPHCRELYQTLKAIEPRYPRARFIFKDLPLVKIHPWAMTASLAARCVYQQNPDAFWKVHDAIFDNQELISADNAWDKLQEFALQAGISADVFRSCMAAPETKQPIDASMEEARALKVTSTPTVFVNGHPLMGGAKELLEQFIDYELAHAHPIPASLP